MFPERPRDRFLTNDEAARLLKALENETKGILKDFITLSLFTGVRRSNLGSMRWKDVDLAQGTWLIPDTKNGSPQHVSLGAFSLDILKKRRAKSNDKDEFVFPGPGKSGHMIDIKTAWIRFRKSIGLNDVTIHDLRRSLASRMASNNVNIALVKDALNYRDLKTTIAVYARTRKTAVVEAKESLHSSWVAKARQLDEVQNDGENSHR